MTVLNWLKEHDLTLVPILILLFSGSYYCGSIMEQFINNKKFELKCLDEKSNSVFDWRECYSVLMPIGILFFIFVFLCFGVLELLVVIDVFLAAEILLWVTAMIRYYLRPLELKKEKWAGAYLSWIFGYIVVLVVFVDNVRKIAHILKEVT